ncbi:furin-like [Saccostrea cucullata]|uniref:furin-like n=1 Tax=Saccostrea cuccullata TaxID=36930 RepID=UPI002ED279DF
MGTKYGRKELGSIFVWSTGNGGEEGILKDYCSYEGLVNNPWVIPVAGVTYDMKKLTSGEQCSAIFITALTKNPNDTIHNIVTTEGFNGTTINFGRNSAAVPMVSGAIALALQANPNLTYRDVMYLLVSTARNTLPFDPYDFQTNGAGIKTSPTFGFGLLDIGALVQKSKTWTSISPVKTYTLKGMPVRLTGSICVEVKEHFYNFDKLEHVSLFISLRSDRAGFLTVILISPCGTRSTLIPGRKIDRRKQLEINVTSVQFWGENPIGLWIIQVEDNVKIEGNVITWELNLLGIKSNVLPMQCLKGNRTCNNEKIGAENFHGYFTKEYLEERLGRKKER